MQVKLLILLLTTLVTISYGQPDSTGEFLHRVYLQSESDEEKVDALNTLANYYYSKKKVRIADSIINEQLYLAELSNNPALVLKTYFENKRTSMSNWSTREDFDRTEKFILDGIRFAKSVSNFDYIALGYSRMAGILRKRGESDRAVEFAMNAMNHMQGIKSDSLKAIVYIELGESYHAKKQFVEAVKSYNNSFIIALKTRNPYLESNIYHRLAELYRDLGETEEAKKQLIKSVAINKKIRNGEGLIKDYLDLARLTDDPRYVELVLSLSDSLHIESYKLAAKNILFAIYMVVQKDSKKARDYLDHRSGLKEYFMRSGIANYYFQLGEIYRYSNQADSAVHYFKLAEPGMMENFDPANAQYVYLEMAASYAMKNDTRNAIDYYEKTLKYSKELRDIEKIALISDSLSMLYRRSGDFVNAYEFKILATTTKDSLSHMAKDRDIALLGVDRESRRLQEDLLQETERRISKQNLQYVAITIAIFIVFLVVLILGAFPISKLTIRTLGYFFFISLFEFIVLVLDNEILHYLTHGEPLKLWLIKIFLIGCIVPFQHWLEHKLIKYLESRKLLKVRTQFSIRKLWRKKPPQDTPAVIINEEAPVVV